MNAQNNPETANQPGRARRAVLTGGAIGLAAAAGTVFGRAQPASAQETPTPLTEITPSGDQSGTTDTVAIMTAIYELATNSSSSSKVVLSGGVVYLGPGDFYITYVPATSTTYGSNSINNISGLGYDITNAAIVVPAQTTAGNTGGYGVSIQGSGSATILHVVLGTSTVTTPLTGIYCHRSNGYAATTTAQQTTSFLRDFVVDGSKYTGTAANVGVDIGDGWGYDLDLAIVNFTTPGSIGLYIINRGPNGLNTYTEKSRFRAQLMNNYTAAVLDKVSTDTDISHEYNFYDFNIFCNQTSASPGCQQGVVVQNGVNNGGCTLWLHGNMATTTTSTTAAALTITGNDGTTPNPNYSRFYYSEIVMKVEKLGTGTTLPYGIFFGSSSNAIEQCHGIITHSLANSNLNGGEFSFRGLISGDPNLSLAYPVLPGATGFTTTTQATWVPGSGKPVTNYGPDMMVYVVGGTVSEVNVSSVPISIPSGTSFLGGFFVPAGGTITLTYPTSAAPTSLTWVPAAYSQS